jgi:hypothetical protein
MTPLWSSSASTSTMTPQRVQTAWWCSPTRASHTTVMRTFERYRREFE